MRLRLLIVLAVFGIAAQESKLPADHYCMAGPPAKNQPRAHECHCKLTCTLDANGQLIEHETTDCKVYCHKDRCLCHADESCSG